MQLLQDVFIVENLQVLAEGKNSDTMKIKGVFGRCNEKNNNGRIYPTSVLEGQLQKVQPLISERRLCGELDHPQNDTVKLSNASHLITKLEMKGNELIGEAEILKTPAGLTAKALVEGGVKIGISSRGMGTLSEDAQGNKIVNEDFRLVTFDLVADPSTRGAFPGLSESTQSQFVREAQSKLEKESNFVTMLQSKLREAYNPWIEEAKKKGKGPTDDDGATTNDSLDPVGQGDADMDNDGDSDSTDKYLKNRREAIGKAMGKKGKAMKAVKEEGSWHQIANAIAEAFADEVEKTSVGQGPAGGGVKAGGGPSFMDRRRDAAGRKSAARADVKAAAIRQKGQIKLARKMEKAKGASAEGKPVTGGEKAAEFAGKAGKAIAAAPGKLISGAERLSKAAKDAGTGAARKAQARKTSQDNIDARKKARVAAISAKKPEAQANYKMGEYNTSARRLAAMKPGVSDEEKYQRKALGQADQKKATADVASRAKAGAEGQFGAGVGRSDKADMHKAIARRERKTGKKVNLTKQQALDLSHRIYSRMGHSLAEAFGLVEKVTISQRWAGSDAAQDERKRQVRAGGKADQKTIDRVRNRAAQRATPAQRDEPDGFRKMSRDEYKEARSKIRRSNIVRADPPTVGEVGRSKPGSEHRQRQADRRQRHQDQTTPQRKLPDHTEYKRIGAIMAEALLFEFDPRHEKREPSKRPGARGAQISGSLAADYAGDQEKRKADKDLSSEEEIKRRAKKAANRARNRVGGTEGQQADPVLNNPDERAEERENPEPKNPQEKANMVRRARQQRAKKGDR